MSKTLTEAKMPSLKDKIMAEKPKKKAPKPEVAKKVKTVKKSKKK